MYESREREIYKLPVGDRFADPLAARRRLLVTTNGRLNSLLDDHEGEDAVAAAVAEEELVKATRTAFGLPPLTPTGGVADADVLATLTDFLAWLSKPASADATVPSSPPPTDFRG